MKQSLQFAIENAQRWDFIFQASWIVWIFVFAICCVACGIVQSHMGEILVVIGIIGAGAAVFFIHTKHEETKMVAYNQCLANGYTVYIDGREVELDSINIENYSITFNVDTQKMILD